MKKIVFSILFLSLFLLNTNAVNASININIYDETTKEFIQKYYPNETEDGIITDEELKYISRSIRIAYDNEITKIDIKDLEFIEEQRIYKV